MDRALDRLSMDDQEEPYVQDPTDPTRFSQSQVRQCFSQSLRETQKIVLNIRKLSAFIGYIGTATITTDLQ